jgi:hypothetical protein
MAQQRFQRNSQLQPRQGCTGAHMNAGTVQQVVLLIPTNLHLG